MSQEVRMSAAHREPSGPLSPVLDELSRITGEVDTERAARDRDTIEELRREVTALRVTVAQLRGSRHTLTAPVRETVARAGTDELPAPRLYAAS
jgi:uncharacterized coiled-coil protein SlyX